MTVLWLDYESQSECDLIAHGSYNYAQHATTKMLCAAYAFGDEDVQLWWAHEPVPERIREYFAGDGQIRCHNAAFDRLITWYVVCQDYDLPEPALERWYCTAAQARANCLPGSLEDVGRAISSVMRKDHRGKQLVRQCCLPPFNKDPAILRELGEYAMQDVRAMRSISKAMRDLSDDELADYHVNERINDRGLLVDIALCRAAAKYAAQEVEETEREVVALTEGIVTSVRSPRLREWVWNNVGNEAKKLMQTYKDGEAKKSLDKNARLALINFAEENADEVPAVVANVIQAADNMFSSSVAKFSRLANLADEEDCRLRGAFIFAGGSATGRYSSTGAQLQNMSRVCADNPDAVRHALVRGHEIVPTFGSRVTDVLKSMLRPAIMAPKDRRLIALDWSGIEARMTPWCSASAVAEKTLDVFRAGKDIYVSTAAAMFNMPEEKVTKAERMLGKVAVLACGFGGSVGAFASMGRIYGVTLSEVEAKRMVTLWRRANPWAPVFWQQLESAMLRAMRNPGHEFSAGKVTYMRQDANLWYALPSGRVLCYPQVRFEDDGSVSYAKAAWKPAAGDKEWPRARLWVGVLIENLVQASANCLLRHALRRLDAVGIKVVGSVHDEIIAECLACDADDVRRRMEAIMTTAPSWAEGLPLEVEGDIMERFSK